MVSLPGSFPRIIEASWFYARGIVRKLLKDDILFLASGLAFNGIMTMIPLLLLGASVAGVVLNSSELAVQRVTSLLGAIFPAQPFALSIKTSILTVISDIVAHRTSLGILALLALIWTSTSLFDALRSVLHTIYGVERSRNVILSYLRHIGFVLLVFILFISSSVTMWVFSLLEGAIAHVPALASFRLPSLNTVLPTITIFALTACMFYIIYRHIPDTSPPKAAAIISTVSTTVLWVLSGRIFSWYLSSFSAIGKIYGPYAFILVLLVWVYYSSVVFVVGGVIGHVYWERRKLRAAATHPFC